MEKFDMELFLIGDLKFLFMVLGRSGFCGNWCLYCMLKKSEWIKQHQEKDSIHCEARSWTIEELLATSLTNQQADGQVDEDFEETFSKGVRDAPLWDFIPIKNVIPPTLHILLGLGNDIVSKLTEWLDNRIEKLSPDEIEARNMSLLAHISVEEASVTATIMKQEHSELVAQRVHVNKQLKGFRNLTVEEQKEFKEEKEQLVNHKIPQARLNKEDADVNLKDKKKQKSVAELKEAQCRKDRGHGERCVRVMIERNIFPKYKMKFSDYHGGDMVGPSLRQMMANGKEVFADIATLVNEVKSNSAVKEEEINEQCESFGRLCSLMDGIFSKVNTKRGEVEEEVIVALEKELDLARHEWKRVGLNQTPKFHLLLDHVAPMLRLIGGFVDMGEDVIERFHQYRFRDETKLIRLRNQTFIKNSQAKMQNTRLIPSVREWQEKVNKSSKRKRKQALPLAQERKMAKKVERDGRRQEAVESVSKQDQSKKIPAPRERHLIDLLKEGN